MKALEEEGAEAALVCTCNKGCSGENSLLRHYFSAEH